MLSRREKRLIRSLRQRKHRQAERCFLAEGERLVGDLVRSGLEVRLVAAASSLEDSVRGVDLVRAVEERGLRMETLSATELTELATTQTPQGVIAVGEIPGWRLDTIELGADPVALLVLDAVQDPGNLGTMVRTAEALGAGAVVALPGTTDPWSPKAVRAAAGSAFRVPVLGADWDDLAPWLGEQRCVVLAADTEGSPLGPVRPRRAALVVGNEGAGVSPTTRARAASVVGIPLRGRAESLNVAAAATILLYELLR